jgi:hypothetical protein
MTRTGCAALAALLAGVALAQAPAGTTEVTADGCKLYLPSSEAKGASRIRWSGQCKEGLADGRGVVRIYSGGKISRVSESTFAAGKVTSAGESYFIRGGEAIRSRGGDNLQIAASELPTWALELSMLVEDRPVRAAPKPAPRSEPTPRPAEKAAPEQKAMEEKAKEAARKADAQAAAEKLAAEKTAQDAERKRLQAERAALEAERKRLQAEKLAADKAAQEAERKRLQAEKERIAAEAKAAAEKRAAEKAAAEAKAAADKVTADKLAQEAEQRRQQAERERTAAEAKAAAETRAAAEAKAAADKVAAEKAAQEAEQRRVQAERERAAAEAKVAAEAKAAADKRAQEQIALAAAAKAAAEKPRTPYVPGRGFADAGSGEPLRAVVTFKLTTEDGRELGVATFVAGKGEAAIRQNASALASAYEKVSPFKAKLLEQPEVGSICSGPGYVVEARVTYPSAKSYGWYAGCMGDDIEQAAKSMQGAEQQLHRDFRVSATSFWAYQYLIVGYVDEGGIRGRAEYERVARPGLMAPGRVMVLTKPEQWAECNDIVNKDPKLKDKVACLREAVGKLKASLGLR